ncbi:MAG: hypothetical protein HS101_18425 [Planctomycetia bacterium]|nr:hypothetical protein [Planctomycetia bacterium]
MEKFSLFETEVARSFQDHLLTESRLYKHSKDYKDLLDFVVRLRNFAPFNAMLLQVQKPGLGYAASARDWLLRFGRKPKEGARPLAAGRPLRFIRASPARPASLPTQPATSCCYPKEIRPAPPGVPPKPSRAAVELSTLARHSLRRAEELQNDGLQMRQTQS